MSATNSVSVVGYVAREPRVWNNDEGQPTIGSFSVGVNERRWDTTEQKVTNQKTWIDVVGKGRLAKAVVAVVAVGRTIAVSGRLDTQTYEKDGVTQYRTQVEAEDITVVDWGDSDSEASSNNSAPQEEEEIDPENFPF